MAVFAGPEIVNNGLVLHLDAANDKSYPGSGTTCYNLSDTNRSGTLINGTAYSSGSFQFDGVNDYVNLGDYSAIKSFGDKITVNVYMKTPVTQTNLRFPLFLSKRFSFGTGNTSYTFSINNTVTPGSCSAQIGTSTETVGVSFTERVNTNTWWMLTLTYDGAEVKGYQNALLTDTNPLTGNIAEVNYPLYLGVGLSNGGISFNEYKFLGNIGIVQIYNRALSESEIKQNFESTRSRYGI